MKKYSHTSTAPMLGITSIMVIFSVISLAVFSVLTLTTAQAEKRLSDSAAAASTAYYEADTQAEMIYFRLRSGELPENVYIEDSVYSYHIPISDHTSLQVRLRRDGEDWTVLCWKTIVHSQPEIQQTLSLWDGGTLQEVFP